MGFQQDQPTCHSIDLGDQHKMFMERKRIQNFVPNGPDIYSLAEDSIELSYDRTEQWNSLIIQFVGAEGWGDSSEALLQKDMRSVDSEPIIPTYS
ncbi:hypothetical protein NPIL_207411 [Nephila pilipes]|uniref:Uncharacterized protein n=1 Tax=Nephila pilipes TaxID=299642 RepID=A0A8X6UL23_NEPPI|nr:hypothetical protein NPIL_207411 [Nephila pilipes]